MLWERETFVVDPRPSYHYRVSGNRYTPSHKTASTILNPSLSLVFLHAAGMFKECFEPVIELLFQKKRAYGGVNIGEIWAIGMTTFLYADHADPFSECPNHGQSAVLNAKDIARDYQGEWSLIEYCDAVSAFLRGQPGGHDLLQKELVFIGQSVGAITMSVLVSLLSARDPAIRFHSIILGDPILGPRSTAKDMIAVSYSRSSFVRQDVWPSRDEARGYLDEYSLTKAWKPESKDLFVKYALMDHSAGSLPKPFDFRGVTLACRRDQEAACYRAIAMDSEAHRLLARLYSSNIPVYYIYDLKPNQRAAQIQPGIFLCEGTMPTATYGIRAGHLASVIQGFSMFVQNDPGETATALAHILKDDNSKRAYLARL
ncbi:hypothetical protein SISSUDRAFT_1030011 [Sistotremastrum suecicum HHB10207 ss-3]|uniref:AB hydrolase-1 domain-containing protein n=1 Tax=Sistotremastrum suecicum HHB10207 ss-3 TaxID=1314776 RepID=A0A166HWI1_9AGAM|nr:hypothetical protein SISSUDRAFT_1030011 [Sistotremastrum suecicum HHB10207 ss-3]